MNKYLLIGLFSLSAIQLNYSMNSSDLWIQNQLRSWAKERPWALDRLILKNGPPTTLDLFLWENQELTDGQLTVNKKGRFMVFGKQMNNGSAKITPKFFLEYNFEKKAWNFITQEEFEQSVPNLIAKKSIWSSWQVKVGVACAITGILYAGYQYKESLIHYYSNATRLPKITTIIKEAARVKEFYCNLISRKSVSTKM